MSTDINKSADEKIAIKLLSLQINFYQALEALNVPTIKAQPTDSTISDERFKDNNKTERSGKNMDRIDE